ncbi:MAG: ABC transporter ATP-binding protein, partial [Rickettsiales bacterium]|nr:ABC transporter ATP-binding protein [Rickettsiales bacterium]
TEHASKYARKLSGGMRRRLLVGKALVQNPDVLILDEPTAGVDVELRDQLWNYVKKLNESGTTILLTTHYLEEAETLCDHISVINHGEVVVSDSKESLIQTLDQKVLEITTESTLSEIPESLKDLKPEIASNGKLLISYQSKQHSFDQILHRITESSITIKDLTTREADLEKVFRHLTKKAA